MFFDIPGYEGLYAISPAGEVLNIKTGLIKKPWVNNKGYLIIDLTKDGITKHYLLHRLLAESFIPNPYNHPVVMHLDNNKQNLDLDNLHWGTYSENNAQAIADGLKPMPRPDNRKMYTITDCNGYNEYFYGADEVLKAIQYGSESVVRNLLFRHTTIKHGPYKGLYLEKVV